LHPYWARVRQPLPHDPVLHACAVAFISDYMVVSSAQTPESPPAPGSRALTVDHALWFHRRVDAADWLLFSADPLSVSHGRGLSRGAVHSRDGELVASFAQEVLTRPVRAQPNRQLVGQASVT